jgi:hypothetical protein
VETKKAALAYVGVSNSSEDVSDVISITATDTEAELADITTDEAITFRALDLLGSRRNDAYEVTLAALREDTRMVGGRAGARSGRIGGR